MHFSTIALVVSLAAIVAASPHPPFTDSTKATPVVAARACNTIYPSTIQALSSTDPDMTFDNTAPAHFAGNSIIKLSQNQTSATEPPRTLQYISFEVPHTYVQRLPVSDTFSGLDAWGCQLKITDQNKLLTWTNSSAGQRVPSINVISLEPNSISGKVTYNSIIKSDIVSTPDYGYFAIPPGGKSIINSEACPALATDGSDGRLGYVFEFEYPTWKGLMEWSLPQQVPGEAGVQTTNGVYMTYGGC